MRKFKISKQMSIMNLIKLCLMFDKPFKTYVIRKFYLIIFSIYLSLELRRTVMLNGCFSPALFVWLLLRGSVSIVVIDSTGRGRSVIAFRWSGRLWGLVSGSGVGVSTGRLMSRWRLVVIILGGGLFSRRLVVLVQPTLCVHILVVRLIRWRFLELRPPLDFRRLFLGLLLLLLLLLLVFTPWWCHDVYSLLMMWFLLLLILVFFIETCCRVGVVVTLLLLLLFAFFAL